MGKLGRRVYGRYPHWIIGGWLLLCLFSLSGVFSGFGTTPLFDRLQTTQPTSPDSQSARGKALLETSQAKTYRINALVEAADLPQQIDSIAAFLRPVHRDLLKIKGVKQVLDPFIIFDSHHPAGKQAAQQSEAALNQALTKAQSEARKQALAQGIPQEKLTQVLDRAKRTVINQFEAKQPKKLALIQQSPLIDLINLKQNSFLLVVELEANGFERTDPALRQQVETILRNLPTYFTGYSGQLKVEVTDPDLIQTALSKRIQHEVLRGEIFSMPIALLIMVIVFGGIVAALLPLIGAGTIIALSLLVLLGLTCFMPIESYVVNVVSSLSLGLSIDYGLLIVSRYRKELAQQELHYPPNYFNFLPRILQRLLSISGSGSRSTLSSRSTYYANLYQLRQPYLQALQITLKTAGRTVAFSGIVVSLAILTLAIFPQGILKSMGAGGTVAVLLSVLVNLSLTPALLLILGPLLLPKTQSKVSRRINQLAVLGAGIKANFIKPGKLIQGWNNCLARFPKTILLVSTVILIVLALPITHLQIRSSGIEVVPREMEQISTIHKLWQRFPQTTVPQVTIISRQAPDQLDQWITQLPSSLKSEIRQVSSAEYLPLPTQKNTYSRLDIYTNHEDGLSAPVQDFVTGLRTTPVSAQTFITGMAAIQLDFQTELLDWVPIPLTLMFLSTFLIILFMTRSILIPLQAIVLNSVSLLASLGVSVWFFQFGHGESVLNFSSLGALESYVVAIIICFGFGLSMDYELFLVSRIKEHWDQSKDNRTAVLTGLSQSAGIITSAAIILVVVFLGFAAGHFQPIQQIGFGLAVAIALDATVVRMGLVPALMILLGKANWWHPLIRTKKLNHARSGQNDQS